MPTNAYQLLALVAVFFTSWQVKTLAGLILLDVVLGVASALRSGVFEWGRLASFYRTMVIPYILGYLALYLAVSYIIPAGSLSGYGDIVNEGAVTMAWGALVVTLFSSIRSNFAGLYQFRPPTAGQLG